MTRTIGEGKRLKLFAGMAGCLDLYMVQVQRSVLWLGNKVKPLKRLLKVVFWVGPEGNNKRYYRFDWNY